MPISIREKDQDNLWIGIELRQPCIKKWSSAEQYNYAIERSKNRLADNPFVQLIDEQAKWVKSRQDDFDYTLNYTDYLKQNEERDQKSKKFDRPKDFEPFHLSHYQTIYPLFKR